MSAAIWMLLQGIRSRIYFFNPSPPTPGLGFIHLSGGPCLLTLPSELWAGSHCQWQGFSLSSCYCLCRCSTQQSTLGWLCPCGVHKLVLGLLHVSAGLLWFTTSPLVFCGHSTSMHHFMVRHVMPLVPSNEGKRGEGVVSCYWGEGWRLAGNTEVATTYLQGRESYWGFNCVLVPAAMCMMTNGNQAIDKGVLVVVREKMWLDVQSSPLLLRTRCL